MFIADNKAVVHRYIEVVIKKNQFELTGTFFVPERRELVRAFRIQDNCPFPYGQEETLDEEYTMRRYA